MLAAEATGARAALLWRYDGDEEALAATAGPAALDTAGRIAAAVHEARRARDPVTVETIPDGAVATLQLGEPPVGALQLVLPEAPSPSDPMLPRLATFAVRAAHMLRVAERRRVLAEELERSRALLAIVGQAISELSLAHTLDTAVARVCELLSADRLAVYLLDKGNLETAAECGLTGPHASIGQRMLDLALGPGRARGLVFVPDAADERLDGVRGAVEELGVESVLAVPLRSGEELVGLLAAYLERGRTLTANEESLLLALASQLAVAVQNARLHEDVEREREEATREQDRAEAVSKRLQALYDISRSFTESLSLRRTLDAIVDSIVTALEIDAAVLRTPNERGDALVPVATCVREDRLAEPIAQMLSLPQPLSARRPSVYRSAEPLLLDAATARALGPAHEPLIPFLEKGSSAAVIPLESPSDEVLGTLTLLSLDSEHEITDELLQDALSLAGPAALALDNARLHQERQEFTETMQRTLLPQTRPSSKGSTSATSTRPRHGSRSAATSTTSSSWPTGGSRSCSETSRATGSTPRPTWR